MHCYAFLSDDSHDVAMHFLVMIHMTFFDVIVCLIIIDIRVF